ncbi:phage tail protein [Cupriavidus sp. SW-Y-13]|uniref:phage tail protein n=1 Tax=Cupriavidus sp. SW-Y-13 TaxID=2653854 RepID=UPI0013654F7A|nr:phage tail protein [Cupriavidus sp. SW-Y-13]MWL87152.1 hypothetical protein [Cupriavidus sp. SW-Y-13]
MSGILLKLTTAGRAALVNADNTGTAAHRIAAVGLSTAAFKPTATLSAVPNEIKRVETIAGVNVGGGIIHLTIRDDSADQYPLHGFGIYLGNGVLLGTHSAKTPILEKSAAAILLLSTDAEFVDVDTASLTFGDASFANPPASQTVPGIVELATWGETELGRDNRRAVTPAGLTARLRAFAPLASPGLSGMPTAPTAPAGTVSDQIATTAFVQSTVHQASVGQIVLEPRTSARAGFMKANGVVLRRSDYPQLWGYAVSSGALVTEAHWQAGSQGCFSSGDGEETFRIPDLRGEFLRCWDDGRGIDAARRIGSYQASQNLAHAHPARSGPAGRHGHRAWSEPQGRHNHGGRTSDDGEHTHASGISRNAMVYGGGGPQDDIGEGRSNDIRTSADGRHGHTIPQDGSHVHIVGMNEAEDHIHPITIDTDGGGEARPRNIALLAMIRAY